MKTINLKDRDDIPIYSVKFNIFYNIDTTILNITYRAYKEHYATGFNSDLKEHPTFRFSSEEKNMIKKSVRDGIKYAINDTISQLITTFDFILLWDSNGKADDDSIHALVSVSENRQ
jgi:hypothetical protein